MGASTRGNTASSTHDTAHASIPPLGSSGSVSMTSETEASASKRARKTDEGPVHGCPMPLRLEESKFVTEADNKGRGKQLQCTSLYYPGHGDNNHDLSRLDPDNDSFYKPRVDDHNGDSNGDWNDDEQDLQIAIKNPSRFAKVMANKRPSWLSGEADVSLSTPLSIGMDTENTDSSAQLSDQASVISTPRPTTSTLLLAVAATTEANISAGSASLPVPTDTPTKCKVSPESGLPNLHVDTNLVFQEGSKKLMLTHQRPIIRTIVQDAIDNLRASLLIRNAFPDPVVAWAFTKDALHLAAEWCEKPGATTVQARLQDDDEYMAKLVSLPRAWISLIRSEVKDRITAVSYAAILSIGSATEVARVIGNQLSNYTYTFPRVPPNMGAAGLVKRSLPYRNEHIIVVIRELYFTGDRRHLHPVHFNNNGRPTREVPVPMVALVATALYATLYEWHTGEQQNHEFSANAYMDVYAGHMNTLRHVMENWVSAFHIMMSNIYVQASTTPGAPLQQLPSPTLILTRLKLEE
ncbi:hypothetical protein EI94DRAFT_1709340 [Lactarius quietus]|nr:hypothetical protein EI94DRAFT_1709340 [Lactarius quietus]